MFWCTAIICVCFTTPIETSPKYVFWTLQQYLLVTKIVDNAFFSWCAGIKRGHWCLVRAVRWMTCKLEVLAGKKGADLIRFVKAHIAIVYNDSSSLVRLSNFSEDFRQTDCGVPLRIDRPTMLKWNSSHMASFVEETGHHFLRSDLSTNNFHWIWLRFIYPHGGLLLCFGLIRTDRGCVTCDDLINVVWGTAIVFSNIS